MAPPTQREAVGFLAQMALRLGRYDDVVEAMNELVEKYTDFSLEEEELIWAGCQRVFREKHRLLNNIHALEEEFGNSKYAHQIELYREVVEFEMMKFCQKTVDFVDKYLLPSCNQYARWNKMVGDLCWNQCSLISREEGNREVLLDKTMTSYKAAFAATECLLSAHPERMSVLLNLSSLYFDETNEEDRAVIMAEDGVEQALSQMSLLDEDSHRETSGILELIMENLSNWAVRKVVKESADTSKRSTEEPAEVTKSHSAYELDETEKVAAAKPYPKLEHNADEPDDAEEKVAAAEPGLKLKLDAESGSEPDAKPHPEPAKEWTTPYSTRSPSPVRPRAVSRAPRLTFADPPTAPPEERLTEYQIRQRKNASQARRGMMG